MCRDREMERVAPDGVESVPGAIATGSVNVTMDHYVSCDPVATAPGTDLIAFANSRMAPQKSSVSKKKFSATTSVGAARSIGR